MHREAFSSLRIYFWRDLQLELKNFLFFTFSWISNECKDVVDDDDDENGN